MTKKLRLVKNILIKIISLMIKNSIFDVIKKE